MKPRITIYAIAFPALLLVSCGLITEDIPECERSYRVRFKYTANILNADAFPSHVSRINLAIYREDGRLLRLETASRELTELDDYYMQVDIGPGRYDLIAWCEGEAYTASNVSFILDGQNPDDHYTLSGAHLDLHADGTSLPSHERDIAPLYYGRAVGVEVTGNEIGDVDLALIPLMKDTNHLTVVLQHLNGDLMDPDDLEFTLEGSNATLDWQNNITAQSDAFHYRPWQTAPVNVITGETRQGPSRGVRAEFTTSRLMTDMEQTLNVRMKATGKEVLSIPLVEYLLLVRNHYTVASSAQDYLDRVDDYSMVFFLNENNTWINSSVIINGWRIVVPQEEEMI